MQVLNRGKKFAVEPSKKNVLGFMSSCEAAVENMKDVTVEQKTVIRQQIASAISCIQTSNNLPKNEKEALRSL